MSESLEAHAGFAAALADAVRPVVLEYFRTALDIERKPDLSPVTAADRAAERRMRAMIEARHPDHGIIGEEYGSVRPDASWCWVLDPIDGTRAFTIGRPLFGTLIALCRDGLPMVGVIDAPALDERWIGVAGAPTRCNGRPVRCRPCPDMAAATLATTSPDMHEGGGEAGFARLRAAVRQTIFGGDCHNYGLLASGFVDLVAETGLAMHDYMALVPVIEGAGGRITDWQGRPCGTDGGSQVIACGDPRLHDRALTLLAG